MVFKRNDNEPDFCQCCRCVWGKAYSYNDRIGYIAHRNLNIRIHRDITGEMGVGALKAKVYLNVLKKVGQEP